MKQNKNILRAALLLLLVIAAPEARAQQLITDNGDGTYTITMPAGNVMVTADVKKLLAHKDISGRHSLDSGEQLKTLTSPELIGPNDRFGFNIARYGRNT